MKVPCREKIVSTLKHHAASINNRDNINKMIMIHEVMINTFYSREPACYKKLFKQSRLNIYLSIFSIYYCMPEATINIVKELMSKQHRLISINALNALLNQLQVTGRLEIYRNKNNRRESLFRPSTSAIQEVYELIQCMLKPYLIIHHETHCLHKVCAAELVPSFFSRYGDFLFTHITMAEVLPDATLFIEKDAGNMIMLALYKEYVQQNKQRILISHKAISGYSHVSRTHVCSLLKEAQAAGFISVENNLFIELSNEFIELYREYFSLYMAKSLYAANITPA